jgi:hypothetical protein
MACPNAKAEYKVDQYLEAKLEDFDFYVTSTKAVIDRRSKEIWTNPVNPEVLIEA